jgi:hypothetical protein
MDSPVAAGASVAGGSGGTGGSAAGGSVGGDSTVAGGSVGKAGTEVLGTAVTMITEFSPPFRCAGVLLTNRVGVLVGVRVDVGVIVGVAETRGVTVAVKVGVLLGTVAVGKGPMRAATVPATAVFVLFASCDLSCKLNALDGPKTRRYAKKTKPTQRRLCIKMYKWVRFLFGESEFTVDALL